MWLRFFFSQWGAILEWITLIISCLVWFVWTEQWSKRLMHTWHFFWSKMSKAMPALMQLWEASKINLVWSWSTVVIFNKKTGLHMLHLKKKKKLQREKSLRWKTELQHQQFHVVRYTGEALPSVPPAGESQLASTGGWPFWLLPLSCGTLCLKRLNLLHLY